VGTGTGAGPGARTTTWRVMSGVLETTQRLLPLTCTHGGEQTLDDGALGRFWAGVVQGKRKGRERE
jgi:hypothetical protein